MDGFESRNCHHGLLIERNICISTMTFACTFMEDTITLFLCF
uniref:Uncharacterized protein n=1 Tax=Arundo donax TaxID=35708 RepID=A0A0A9FKD4_ARUDO